MFYGYISSYRSCIICRSTCITQYKKYSAACHSRPVLTKTILWCIHGILGVALFFFYGLADTNFSSITSTDLGFLRPSLFGTGGTALRTDAVTCQSAHGNNIIIVDNLEFCCFNIKFWDGKSKNYGTIFSVVVHAPAHCEASKFLYMFLKPCTNMS